MHKCRDSRRLQPALSARDPTGRRRDYEVINVDIFIRNVLFYLMRWTIFEDLFTIFSISEEQLKTLKSVMARRQVAGWLNRNMPIINNRCVRPDFKLNKRPRTPPCSAGLDTRLWIARIGTRTF
ncbi:hypothetical protein EVAR_21362_1 [Eumeta japonica]|uniref:Uncharacterized protein n=1 Tax=Eumeta variegata TaxID=151549 RepID=A0A4C1YBE8_EUMVA|nr:hypothetical protein EVAR_21362_1 [Eumeta japonica]